MSKEKVSAVVLFAASLPRGSFRVGTFYWFIYRQILYWLEFLFKLAVSHALVDWMIQRDLSGNMSSQLFLVLDFFSY